MANIVIKELFPSDSLTEAVEKLNFNFDQIILAGGGPPGEKGVTGSGGGQGPQGDRGNYWFFGATYGGITGTYYGGTNITGDSFLGTAGTIFTYSTTGSTGWFNTGINLIGPTGAPGVTGGSLEVQYYLGATDIGVNSWLPATAYGATTTRSTNRDILSIISGDKNIVFLGGTSWAQQQLSDFGYYPLGSNNQSQLPALTVIQQNIDSSTIGGIAIGGVGLTSATGGTLPTPGDFNEPVSALDFMYLGFEESTDPWNTSAIHRSLIRNPKTSMAIKIGGNGALEKYANLSIESQFINLSDYSNDKVYITGNYSTGGTATAGFISIFSKNVGFNPLTGTGRQGLLVLQGVEGSYSLGSYQHRLGTVIIGSTSGLGGNVIGGAVISRTNTGGIQASNNYDSHISLHADSTANAVTKIIASVDSTGLVKRTQFVGQRIGLIGPSAAANNALVDSFNNEYYAPKMPIHEIIDVANTITISGAGSGVPGLTLPTSLQGIRVIKGTEVRESSGGGFLFALTPEYLVQSRSLPGLTGPTASYGYQDIIWQTYPKGATNPTPNIWLQPGATFNGSTAIGGNVIVGGVMPGGTYTGASYLGRFLTSKFSVAGPVAIGDSTYYGPGVEPPSNGLRIQGDILQNITTGNPSGNTSYRAGIYTTRALGSLGAVLSGSDGWLGGWAAVMNNLGTAGIGGAGYPSWFSAAFERTVIINGKKTNSGYVDYGLNLLNPSGEVASLYVNGWSLFGDYTFAQSWNTLNYAPWYTGGIVAPEIHIGNPQSIGVYGEGYPTASQFSMNSTTKGFLPPRMTAAERLAISTVGATGLVVYQLAGASAFHEGLWVYQSTGWTGPLR